MLSFFFRNFQKNDLQENLLIIKIKTSDTDLKTLKRESLY
jgi:hypothetical protein